MGDAAQDIWGARAHCQLVPSFSSHRTAKWNDCSHHTLLISNATQAGFQRHSQKRRPGDEFHLSLTDGASAVNTQYGTVTSAKLQCVCLLCMFSQDKCKALVATAASSEIFQAVKVLFTTPFKGVIWSKCPNKVTLHKLLLHQALVSNFRKVSTDFISLVEVKKESMMFLSHFQLSVPILFPS